MIAVLASDNQWAELTNTRTSLHWQRIPEPAAIAQFEQAEALFWLEDKWIPHALTHFTKPVILHAVIDTLDVLNLPANFYRINAWPGFLSRPVWEIAGTPGESIDAVFKNAGIKADFVKDEPGFVSARVIAMIINEAYYALEDAVSSKTEIDTAMKLGTNYPAGPFEWAAQIGVKNIVALLQKLYAGSNRYKPSAALIAEATIPVP